MSDLQQAIAWFESRAKNTPMPGARKMFQIALEALREKEEHLEIIRDLVGQFAYKSTVNGRAAYTTGGLSALEAGFAALDWDDPQPAPECECQHPDCHKWVTGGTPTKDGYKFLCSDHFREEQLRKTKEAEQNEKG